MNQNLSFLTYLNEFVWSRKAEFLEKNLVSVLFLLEYFLYVYLYSHIYHISTLPKTSEIYSGFINYSDLTYH